ncbi:unnamed protein product [Candidula unifasciata]|uniref:Uncharacterized protein n=1 Tax=Candidula unifasciata TaxID=100452 RepID=A0A8S3YGT0_9EUPU|nr:unnamed protein product [Candidula unifasciata]
MDSVSLLFKALNQLIAPPTSKPSFSNETSEELLDSILHRNLAAFQHCLAESQDLQDIIGGSSHLLLEATGKSIFHGSKIVPIRQKFTEVCIIILHHICDCFTRIICEANKAVTKDILDSTSVIHHDKPKPAVPDLPPDAISIQQEKTISSAVQFVVVLGICPYLIPGVGIPVSQRLGPGQILLATGHDYTTELNDFSRIQLLIPAIKLFSSMLELPSFKDIILNNYLTDLIAAVLQVRHCVKVILQRTEVPRQEISAVSADCGGGGVKMVESCEGNTRQLNPQQKITAETLSKAGVVSDQMELRDCCTAIFSNVLPDMCPNTSGQPWTLQSIAEFCSRVLDSAMKSSAVPHVLTQLMLLSGGTQQRDGPRPVTPKWFRRTIACMLRDVIMVPPGVQHLITLFVGDSTPESSQNWQKYRAVAQIISRCPVTASNMRQFYTSVSRQLIELIQTPETKVSPHVIRAVGATIQELTSLQSVLMQEVCLSHLFYPLLKLSCDPDDTTVMKDGQIVVPEEMLTHCVVLLHRIFVIGQEPQSSLLSQLCKVARIVFSLYNFTRSSITLIKSHTCDLIKAYLTHCDTAEAAECLISLVSNRGGHSLESPNIGSNVGLEFGPNGGVQAVFIKEKQFDLDSWTQPVESVMEILCGLNSDAITSQLFLCLLQNLSDIVSTESASIGVVLPPRVLSTSQRSAKLAELREKIALVSLLASLGDKYGDKVVQSSHHVLIFVKATLERCVKMCQLTFDDATLSFEWETVSMAMGLLTAILSGALMLSDADKKILDEILPLLTAVSDCDSAEPAVKEMADDLKVAVATRGLVWAEISKLRKTRTEQNKKPETSKPVQMKQNKPLIQVLSETSIEEGQPKASDADVTEDIEMTCESESSLDASKPAGISKLEKALEDLCDPLLPVKGHGLISLARMVEDRDGEVKDKQEMLLKIFLENIAHADSYIYLAAVNGLAALSDLYPDQVIPCLTSEFRSMCAKTHSSKSGETALKVGESLVKATKRLGELTPKYRDLLLPVILCGCRHDDALVRASSLSGLADVCKLLRFSIGPMLHEIVTCCRDIIKSDPDAEPRKAAILTLTLLLQGLGRDVLQTLSDVLLDIYRVLKQSFTFDPDEKVRFNASLALGELDDIMREALFTKPELKKTITILGYQ